MKRHENTANLQKNKKIVEVEVVKQLQKKEYTFKSANIYGENLLHISAASGCFHIMKEILKKTEVGNIIDRKNEFGWTPLMLAIRNRDIDTVKLLLEKGANTNESTYLGMSVLGLAAAINKEMFETVYKACPSAQLNSANDDITPLCVAAMKNDKDLFFALLDLGYEVSKANVCTLIMMRRSTVPEISDLVQQLDIDNYWNDTSDNISIEGDYDDPEQSSFSKAIGENQQNGVLRTNDTSDDTMTNPNSTNSNNGSEKPMKPIFILVSPADDLTTNLRNEEKSYNTNLSVKSMGGIQESIISPTFTCNIDEVFPTSPNICFVEKNYDNNFNIMNENTIKDENSVRNREILTDRANCNKCLIHTPSALHRLQSIRPSDLDIQCNQEDPNATLGYIPEFSPIRSPHVPSDMNDENVFGENTPTPPRYKTPPKGMLLNSEEAKMFALLKRYGLNHYAPMFLEQEVDLHLFMTLSDNDLIEIGVNHPADREALLAAIRDCKGIDI